MTMFRVNLLEKKTKIIKYNIKLDCLAKAKHFSIMAKDSLGIFQESAAKVKIINLVGGTLIDTDKLKSDLESRKFFLDTGERKEKVESILNPKNMLKSK